MAFARANWSPIGGQSMKGKAPCMWSYKTTDAKTVVDGAGNVVGVRNDDGSVVAKVSDFGLAGTVKNTSQMVSKSGVGTINWSAPEVFKEHCEW